MLRDAAPFLIDTEASVDIELVDRDQWLTSCDDEALAGGCNMAVIGGELIQFGEAMPIGPGRFRLSRLMRGRRGTEWAAGDHAEGEPFSMVDADELVAIPLPDWAIGSTVTANVRAAVGSGVASAVVGVESLRPPAPVQIGARRTEGGLALAWTRRSRRGWHWTDETDAPLAEAREAYELRIDGHRGSVEMIRDRPEAWVSVDELARIGPGRATVRVRQIGDWASSRPAETHIDLPEETS